MDIGAMRKRITFLKAVDKDNALGQTEVHLEELKTVWASITTNKGREYQEATKLRPEQPIKIYTRYFKFVVEADAKDEVIYIKHRNKYYDIKSLINVKEADEMLEIEATEFPKQKYKELVFDGIKNGGI